MSEQVFRLPGKIILEGYQPTRSGNVDPERPPRGTAMIRSRFAKSNPDRTAKSKPR